MIMPDIYMGLGSNLGEREQNLRTAISRLSPGILVDAVSPVYETEPKYLLEQPKFLNIACEGRTELGAQDVLNLLKKIEGDLGRERKERFGPRIIDIDLLFYGKQQIQEEELIIPHPGIAERAFVLVPLCDIAPDFTHPVLGVTIKELLGKLGDTSKEVRKTGIQL